MSRFNDLWWLICEENGWDWQDGTGEHWDELSEKDKDELIQAEAEDYQDFLEQQLESDYAAYMYD